MADYRALARRHPAVRDYLKHRRWVRRGDVVAYAPNLACDAFRTDPAGFRLSVHDGRDHGIAATLAAPRHALVLGSSHVFGFGLASDAETLPSRLSERLEMPCANVSFPEADTRTLHGVLTNILSRGTRPAVVVLLTGGDFTRHAFALTADPVFGSPNVEDARPPPDGDAARRMGAASLDAALSASMLWTRAAVGLCRAHRVPVVLGGDRTFMEKPMPDEAEDSCGLGTAGGPSQLWRFDHQRRHGAAFYAARRGLADELGVALAGPDPATMTYIDEYHYRAEGIERFADALSPALGDAMAGG